jgi:hypothetical protein
MKTAIKLLMIFSVAGFALASCEGPQGLPGDDANESCKECHNPAVVTQKATEFELSKHSYGEAAFEEAGNTSCSPCHESEAFKNVVSSSAPSTFTLVASTGKYRNDYQCSTATALGDINCNTCHSSLHTTYTGSDFSPLTTTAAVSMTMWGGSKTINLTADGGKSNLCVKCHQPRPLTTSTTLSDGNLIDYAALITSPGTLFYDAAVGNNTPNKLLPSYRMHVHYGGVGAIYAGLGGVEFPGTVSYLNSAHTTAASCVDCHMAAVYGRAGGHTFKVRSTTGALSTTTTDWNFSSCNSASCHSTVIDKNSTTFWKTTRTEIQGLLNSLATKINAVGVATPILHSDTDGETNPWAGLTTGNYDGYLNIYDPSTNAGGAWKNPGSTGSWTQAQKDVNNALPTFPSLKNAVVGAMINFQLCLREFSLGIHNYKYTKALLQNSIEAMTAAGY